MPASGDYVAWRTSDDLNLYDTRVTDAGLKELKGLAGLRTLNLSGTDITDAGLKELRTLEGLGTLKLGRTRLTQVGVDELRKALPACEIEYDARED